MLDFAARILNWYDLHSRDERGLPWRGCTDPWQVWVSEIMLQQTRAKVVREAFPAFIAAYPTPASWARVSDDVLLRAWQGLGYYRRARLLREGAAQVMAEHGGVLPRDPKSLGKLAGIGEYTQGAIASIAFSLPEAAIDGNVERVFARHAGIDGPIKSSAVRKQLRNLVDDYIDQDRPGDFNQALMDLGANVCKPRNPDCPACPIGDDCSAREFGQQTTLPNMPAKRPIREVNAAAVLITRPRGRVLGTKIPAGAINEGQIELPSPGILVDIGDQEEIRRALENRFHCKFELGQRLTLVHHSITNHRIALSIYAARLQRASSAAFENLDPTDPAVPWTTASRKALRAVL